jgi:hypothetical protein
MFSRWIVAAIGCFALAPVCAQPRPSAGEQARTLETARNAALHYAETLPDFICTETVERSSNAGPSSKSPDTLTIQLSYFGRKEQYKLLAINGVPTGRPYESLDGLISGGEFGSMLFRIFDPASATGFQWKGWTTVAKRPASVYSYHVARANSHHTVGYRTPAGELRTTTAGQRGVVVLDGETSMALRITTEADELPWQFAGFKASTTIEYAFIEVGGRPYLLPVRAESEVSRPRDPAHPPAPSFGAKSIPSPPPVDDKNIVSFVGYRKFSADSSVDFSSEPDRKKKQIP